MPIGLVDDDAFDLERANSNNGSHAEIVDQKAGRGNQRQVPAPLRKVISETAITEGNGAAKELAKSFNISSSSVSAYKQGAHSTTSYNEPAPALEDFVTKTKDKVHKKAHKTLLSALRHITDEKLEKAAPRDLSGIAKDMSSVVRNMEPEKAEEANVKFIFYSPPMKKEESFEVIDVLD